MGDMKSYVDGLRVVLKEASIDTRFKRPSYSVMREMARQRGSLIAPQTLVGQSAKNLFIGMDAMQPLKFDPTSQKKLFSTNPADTVKASGYAADLLKVSKIEKRDGKYVLKTKDGKKVLGTHASKEKAMAQERAINISKARGK